MQIDCALKTERSKYKCKICPRFLKQDKREIHIRYLPRLAGIREEKDREDKSREGGIGREDNLQFGVKRANMHPD